MKKLFTILNVLLCLNLFSMGYWTQKADFGGTARYNATAFKIGNKGYIGFGSTDAVCNSKDFWEYDPLLNTWTQKADFGGTERIRTIGFSIGNYGYVGLGCYWTGIPNDYTCYKDFWRYDPLNNTWEQKADFPGVARKNAASVEIFNYGYVGLGYDHNNFFNDLYKYDPTNNTWQQKASFTGGGRGQCVFLAIGKCLYLGTGLNGSTTYNDFWQYNTDNDTWTQKANYGGCARYAASGFAINNLGYICTGYNSPGSFYNDLWEYNPSNNTWSIKASLPSDARSDAIGMSINNKGYIGLGYGSSYLRDFWEYTPSSSEVVEYNNLESQINIFPNPAINEINFNFNDKQLISSIALIDITGKILKSYPSNTNKIDVSNISNGHYFLSFNINSNIITKEIVIMK